VVLITLSSLTPLVEFILLGAIGTSLTHFLVKSFSSFSLSVDTDNLAERSSPLKKQMVKELKRRKDLESAAIFQQK
jgi:hypothetical protein